MHKTPLTPLVITAGLALLSQLALAAPAVPVRITEGAASEYPALEQLYRDLHANPELSFREKKTAEKVAGELKKLGLEVTTQVGGHGIVGVLKMERGPRFWSARIWTRCR
jgi:hippurate hydrolase